MKSKRDPETIHLASKGALALIISANVLLVAGIAASFTIYTLNYRNRINQQNVDQINTINASASRVANAFFTSQELRLDDEIYYINAMKLDAAGTVDILAKSNSNVKSHYELVATDYTGTAIGLKSDGTNETVAISYKSGYDSFNSVFTETDPGTSLITCTPEFTDYYTDMKSFAVYRHLNLTGGATYSHTLMLVYQSSDFADLLTSDSNKDYYKSLATVIVNSQGDYLFGSSTFQTDNLFKYFREYNNLDLDQKNALASDFQSGAQRTFYFKDYKGRDCIFVSAELAINKDWLAVSAVPLESYHNTTADLWLVIALVLLLLVLAIFDISWLFGANHRLQTAIAREKEAADAKTSFLSRMSHDIRTPLNVVIGNTLLAQREKNPPATTQYLEDINASGNFLLALVNDILDLNKVESGKMDLHPEPYSLRQLRNNLKAIIGPLATEKSQTFTITGCDSDQAYLLDPIRVEQVFFNILSNSVKFTPNGRSLSLVCETKPGENGDTLLVFTAKDDGKGMSKEFQKMMFEPFTQETVGGPKVQGTGLGLAIVHNLVSLMNGTIGVVSALNEGTTFTITLPAKTTATPKVEPQIVGTPLLVLKGKRVLVCEDNDLNANILMVLLKDKGLLVERAPDGEKGLEMFIDSAPNHYQAILMDMRMPVMDGLTATKKIRELARSDAKSIPIIAMTANAYDSDVQNCLDAGMNSHLAKPVDPAKIYSTLAHYLSLGNPDEKK
jgi:signal transduction histidine kinase/ActR/RegA family two-component response regulator